MTQPDQHRSEDRARSLFVKQYTRRDVSIAFIELALRTFFKSNLTLLYSEERRRQSAREGGRAGKAWAPIREHRYGVRRLVTA